MQIETTLYSRRDHELHLNLLKGLELSKMIQPLQKKLSDHYIVVYMQLRHNNVIACLREY